MSPKQKRRRARHARRVARRTTRKRVAATFSLAASLTTLRTVQTLPAFPQSISHPTWDQLLDRIGMGFGDIATDGRLKLRCWVHDLVLCPKTPQPALLLTGPECSGKTVFHEAMGLLLPDHAVVQYLRQVQMARGLPRPIVTQEEWQRVLNHAWLMVAEGHPERFSGLFGRPRKHDGRYLKWCIKYTQSVSLPGVEHFEMRLLATTIPRPDLIQRLKDERDAFQRTLARCRAAA